ncbi:MAG: creatininase family protein [Planctomycetota bacterium]|nr:creatininase family protein [Planctomycetota bacterium]
MKETKVRWEEMFPEEFVESRDASPICYMGYGLAEPHGAYNALGLDFIKAQGILERAATESGGIVAPPMAWHITDLPAFHTGRDGWFNGVGIRQSLASSIPADLFYRMVLFQIRAFDARGFHAAILVTGHYGGLERHIRLLCEYYLRRTCSPIQLYACADWELIRHEDYRGDHAGVTETSQLMAVRPDLVDLEREDVPAELGTNYAGSKFPDNKGRSPSRELGEKIVNSQIERLGEIKDELLAAYTPRENWTAPSMTEAEDIWHRYEALTRKYWSVTYEEYRKKSVPEFPGWEAFGE